MQKHYCCRKRAPACTMGMDHITLTACNNITPVQYMYVSRFVVAKYVLLCTLCGCYVCIKPTSVGARPSI